MNSFKIAWRSVRQRWLASWLTIVSMALGVTLVVTVLTIHGVVSRQFRNNASLGYNLVVGATKGGRLQLTLNSVYYLSRPVENIDYRYFLEFMPPEVRRRDHANSAAQRGHELAWKSLELHQLAAPTPAAGLATSLALDAALERVAEQRAPIGRAGLFSQYTAFALPLCLGDYYGRFRVVATTPEFFTSLVFDPESNRGFEFAEGQVFEDNLDPDHRPEYGFFGAVVGATVARELNIQVGHRFTPAHGDPEGHSHERDFVVTGVLAPSGTPNDRAVFVNIEGFFLMEGHARPLARTDPFGGGEESTVSGELTEATQAPADERQEGGRPPDESPPEGSQAEGHEDATEEHSPAAGDAHFQETQPLPLENREVTAVLVRTLIPGIGGAVMNAINEGQDAQCAQPVQQIFELLDVFVRPVQLLLLAMTAMICLVSAISILVSIYNSMSERRQEIAVIRALGANRGRVQRIVLLESVILSMLGGGLGWLGGHTINWLASDFIEQRTGVRLGFFDFAPPLDLAVMSDQLGLPAVSGWLDQLPNIPPEPLLIPALILLAILVGLIPARTAYRTDVARWLGK